MTEPILQASLPVAPWTDPRLMRLPGTGPADPDDWVRVDEAYAGQMALRDRLLAERRAEVLDCLPEARAATAELLAAGLDRARRAPGFAVTERAVLRPDGVSVPVRREDPLGTLGRLFQEDLCLLRKPEGSPEHVLAAAVLCFPAGWTLAEKIGRPLARIHAPVPRYAPIAARAQRLFDGLRPGMALWRANAHSYDDPALFAPSRESAPRQAGGGDYIRSEYQVLFRLPETRAVVFSIHTCLVRRASLTPDQRAALATTPLEPGR